MAATDLITLARAKSALQIGAADTTRDADLQRHITALSQAVDRRYGPVVQRAATETHRNVGSALALRQRPWTSITSITVDGVALAASDWWADRTIGVDGIERLSGRIERTSGACWERDVPIVVTGVAGRLASTAAVVDTVWEHAFALLLAHQWQARTLGVGQAGGYDVPLPTYPTKWPQAVDELLGPESVLPILTGVG